MKPAVGVFLSTRSGASGNDDGVRSFISQAEVVERLGFDSVWTGDSLLARPRPDPLTLLAAIAARTERIALGTAVLLPALRHPLLLAHGTATLDQIASGRLILGVGTGFRYPATERELAAVGVPMAERTARMCEAIDVCRRLWASDAPLSYSGRGVRLEEVVLEPRPMRASGPPIWLGGNEPAALRRAGRLGDGWLPTSTGAEAFASGLAAVREAAAAAGRDPDCLTPAVMLTVNVDPDAARAERALRDWMEAYYGLPLDLLRLILGCRAGTAPQIAEWLAGFVAAGARHIVLRFADLDQRRQIERGSELCLRLDAAA